MPPCEETLSQRCFQFASAVLFMFAALSVHRCIFFGLALLAATTTQLGLPVHGKNLSELFLTRSHFKVPCISSYVRLVTMADNNSTCSILSVLHTCKMLRLFLLVRPQDFFIEQRKISTSAHTCVAHRRTNPKTGELQLLNTQSLALILQVQYFRFIQHCNTPRFATFRWVLSED